MERQYDKLIRLIRETRSNLEELTTFLKEEVRENITEEEQTTLELEYLRFIIVIKELGVTNET